MEYLCIYVMQYRRMIVFSKTPDLKTNLFLFMFTMALQGSDVIQIYNTRPATPHYYLR